MGWCKLMLLTYGVFVSNGLQEKHKPEHQKAILEVSTQLFGIWCKNMKRGQLDYLPEYITFIYGN